MSLENYKNYFMYADMVRDNIKKIVYVPDDININNINDHILAISNILKDGIETDFVHNTKITISWGNDIECDLSLVDYWFNLFMWYMILKTNSKILPKHIFWKEELKSFDLKLFVDKFVINKNNRITIDDEVLNSIICDGLWMYSNIEPFSYYLANTVNNEDDIELMKASQEFYDLMHCTLSNVPFDEVKSEGMKLTNRAISIIKDSEKYIGYEHGLTNSFRASEAINPRQFKEVNLNIGTKPNGSGGIYPYVIDKSFKTGGVNDKLSYFIESSTARAAQIMSKTNVGESGDFARLLGLNNTDTILNLNRQYECMSRHFIKFEIKTAKHLSMIKNRYYRFNVLGMDYLIDDTDLSMVGKTVYLRSPMTCSSNSSGHGICKRCYGDLYYTNISINVGKIAAEILSAQLTQKLLSAKHLLETNIIKLNWCPEFDKIFTIDANSIKLNDDYFTNDIDLKKYALIIEPDKLNLVNNDIDDDYLSDDDEEEVTDDIGNYNEYITEFMIKTPTGELITIKNEEEEPMYISNELNTFIRKKAYNAEGNINISLAAVADDTPLFFIKINNNEISKTMNEIINIINKSAETSKLDKDQALQSLVDLVVEGGLTIDSVHLEVILSNQIVDPDNILTKPNWNNPNAQYKLFTLNQALTNNPSIIVSLLYKDLKRTLYNPLSFSKNAPSFFDLFFCEDPQNYISNELLTDSVDIKDLEKKVMMVEFVDKEDKH